jgi:predicted Zn-dependent protease
MLNLEPLAYSREQEREADQTGLELLVDVFLTGNAAPGEYRQSKLSEYLSTHPNTGDRLSYLQRHAVKEDSEMEKMVFEAPLTE